MLGAVGHLPSILTELEVSYYLLRCLSIICLYSAWLFAGLVIAWWLPGNSKFKASAGSEDRGRQKRSQGSEVGKEWGNYIIFSSELLCNLCFYSSLTMIISKCNVCSGADGQHRVPLNRRPRACRQGRLGQDRLDHPCLHWSPREDCPVQKVRMSCCRLKLINFFFQDRQALEADRLGSNQKRHSRETNGTFLGIQQWPASPPWWCHPLYMSRGQNQFISKASKGLLDIHRATFFKNLALYNTLVTSREEHSWHEQCSNFGATLLFFLQEPWHLCS